MAQSGQPALPSLTVMEPIMKQKFLIRSLVAAGALSIAALGGYASFDTSPISSANAASPVVQSAVTPAGTNVVLPNFTSIVQQNGPAVVNISVSSKLEKTAMSQQELPFKLDPDDPFSQFFRNLPVPRGQMPMR